MAAIFPHLDYKPILPQSMGHGIGIVGAGGIVNYAHLPAYKQAGFKVVGIADKNRVQAERTASDHGIPKVYASVEDLLDDSQVEIVDIAVYPSVQVEVIEQAVRKENISCARSHSRITIPKQFAAWRSLKTGTSKSR